MHFVDLFTGIPFCRKIRLDGLVHDRDKGDNIPQRHVRRRLYPVDLVLLQGRVPQSNFLLVVQPVLIVGPQAGVLNPLLKTQVAVRRVFRDRVSLGRARVPGEVRDAGDDTVAPMFDLKKGRSHRAACCNDERLIRFSTLFTAHRHVLTFRLHRFANPYVGKSRTEQFAKHG